MAIRPNSACAFYYRLNAAILTLLLALIPSALWAQSGDAVLAVEAAETTSEGQPWPAYIVIPVVFVGMLVLILVLGKLIHANKAYDENGWRGDNKKHTPIPMRDDPDF